MLFRYYQLNRASTNHKPFLRDSPSLLLRPRPISINPRVVSSHITVRIHLISESYSAGTYVETNLAPFRVKLYVRTEVSSADPHPLVLIFFLPSSGPLS